MLKCVSLLFAQIDDMQMGANLVDGSAPCTEMTTRIEETQTQTVRMEATVEATEIYLNVAKLFIGKIPAAQNCIVTIDKNFVYFEDESECFLVSQEIN